MRLRKSETLPTDAFNSERGEIPAGWTAVEWRWRLRYMADVCWDAARAEELRRWAEKVERRIPR